MLFWIRLRVEWSIEALALTLEGLSPWLPDGSLEVKGVGGGRLRGVSRPEGTKRALLLMVEEVSGDLEP